MHIYIQSQSKTVGDLPNVINYTFTLTLFID